MTSVSENKVCGCGKSTRSPYRDTCKACDDAAARKSRAAHGAARRIEQAQRRAAACSTGAAKLAKLDAIQASLKFAGPFLQNDEREAAALALWRAEGQIAFNISFYFGHGRDSSVAVNLSFRADYDKFEGFHFSTGEYVVDVRQQSSSQMTVAEAVACTAAMQAAVTFAAVLQAKVAGQIDVGFTELSNGN